MGTPHKKLIMRFRSFAVRGEILEVCSIRKLCSLVELFIELCDAIIYKSIRVDLSPRL